MSAKRLRGRKTKSHDFAFSEFFVAIVFMLIVLTTVSNEAAGEALASKIVEAKLAACVQVLPRMTSVYMWQGRVTKDGEHLLLIKALPQKYVELEAFVNANHGYEIPEIVAIDAERVSDKYLEWMRSVTGDK